MGMCLGILLQSASVGREDLGFILYNVIFLKMSRTFEKIQKTIPFFQKQTGNAISSVPRQFPL